MLGMAELGVIISRREEQVQQAEERFRLLVDRVREYAIFMLDPEGRVATWNEGAEHIKGYQADEIIGQHLNRFYTPEDVERNHPAHLLRVADAEGQVEDEGWRVRKDRSRFWADVVMTAVRGDAGRLLGFAKVKRDLTERRQAEELRNRLIQQAMTAQEEERRRIARELHDEAGQSLTALLVGLRTIEEARTIAEAAELAQRLRGIAAQTLEEVGRLARGLHPSILDDLGLAAAVTRYVQEFAHLHGIAVDVRTEGLESEPPLLLQNTVYRILQEALTNVARHAGARNVSVRLVRDETTVELRVQDDGAGFDPTARAEAAAGDEGRLGLQVMRERAALLSGSVRIASKPGAGTTIEARLPLGGRVRPASERPPAGRGRNP